jgi:hypothetical protein
MMYKLMNCLQTLSLSHLLIHAYSLGCRLAYPLAASNCQLLRATSAACVASPKVVELSKLLKPAVMVLIGSRAEKDDWAGSRAAYMRSNKTVSNTSSTKSMADGIYAFGVVWRKPDWLKLVAQEREAGVV